MGTYPDKTLQNQHQRSGIGQPQQVGSVFFNQVTNIIISFIAAKSVVDGNMTLGMMMSLTYIIGQLNGPISSFIGFAQQLQDAKISLERLNEVHGQKDEEEDIETKLTLLPEIRDIKLENLYFNYDGADRDYVLEDVNLTIPQHKVTAIVGVSGSGKTTLIKLLLGFYAPNKGNIRLHETTLEMINPHVWRARTGSVYNWKNEMYTKGKTIRTFPSHIFFSIPQSKAKNRRQGTFRAPIFFSHQVPHRAMLLNNS